MPQEKICYPTPKTLQNTSKKETCLIAHTSRVGQKTRHLLGQANQPFSNEKVRLGKRNGFKIQKGRAANGGKKKQQGTRRREQKSKHNTQNIQLRLVRESLRLGSFTQQFGRLKTGNGSRHENRTSVVTQKGHWLIISTRVEKRRSEDAGCRVRRAQKVG